MITCTPNLKSLAAAFVSGAAVLSLSGQTVDLSPYYDFLTVDGFTTTYVGSYSDDGSSFSGEWNFRVRLLGEAAGVITSEEELVVAIMTEAGSFETTSTSKFETSATGVNYMGGSTATRTALGDLIETTEVINGQSIFFPAQVSVPGEVSWAGTYRTTVPPLFPGLPEMVIEFETSGTSEFVGFETITVPAGTFEALRVLVTETDDEGVTTSTSWFGKGIGLLKTESEEPGEDGEPVLVTFELTSYQGYTPETPVSRLLTGAVASGGVLFSDWLGYFDAFGDSAWLYHNGLGFIYAASISGAGGYWFYVPFADLGYLYFNNQLLRSAENGEVTGWVYSLSGGGSWLRIVVDPNGTIRLSINGTGDWIEYGG